MKALSLFLVFGISLIPSIAQADTYVRGYYRKDGTYVRPHYRSSPNGTVLDNWSTEGNINPYTGEPGSLNPYRITPSRLPRVTTPQTVNPLSLPIKTNDCETNFSLPPTESLPEFRCLSVMPILPPLTSVDDYLNRVQEENTSIRFQGVRGSRLRSLQGEIQRLQHKYRLQQKNESFRH